jgi:hypothetical protein
LAVEAVVVTRAILAVAALVVLFRTLGFIFPQELKRLPLVLAVRFSLRDQTALGHYLVRSVVGLVVKREPTQVKVQRAVAVAVEQTRQPLPHLHLSLVKATQVD